MVLGTPSEAFDALAFIRNKVDRISAVAGSSILILKSSLPTV